MVVYQNNKTKKQNERMIITIAIINVIFLLFLNSLATGVYMHDISYMIRKLLQYYIEHQYDNNLGDHLLSFCDLYVSK